MGQTRQGDGIHRSGYVWWALRSEAGVLLASGEGANLITTIGDQIYAERGAGVAAAPAAPTGMKLGTSSSAVTKTGTGAALVGYLANSHQGFDSGFPASSLSGSSRRITYQCTWVAGKATSLATPITEVVIVNNTLADATSTTANTMSRILLSPAVPSKSTTDVLTVIWTHDNLGA